MGAKEDKLKNRLWMIGSVIGLLAIYGAFAMSLRDTTAKADEAHAYAKKNVGLGETVERIEKKVERHDAVFVKIASIQIEQKHLISDLQELKEALKTIVENGKRNR